MFSILTLFYTCSGGTNIIQYIGSTQQTWILVTLMLFCPLKTQSHCLNGPGLPFWQPALNTRASSDEAKNHGRWHHFRIFTQSNNFVTIHALNHSFMTNATQGNFYNEHTGCFFIESPKKYKVSAKRKLVWNKLAPPQSIKLLKSLQRGENVV